MIYAVTGSTFEASADGFNVGLVGTIGVTIKDEADTIVVARTTANITDLGGGVYIGTFMPPANPGAYVVVWDDGSNPGPLYAAEDLTVTAAGYITLADLKTTLGINVTTWDADLSQSIAAAAAAINQICQRTFYTVSGTYSRYYSPVNPSEQVIDDLVAVTSLVTRDDGGDVDTDDGGLQTWTLHTDYELAELNAASQDWPYTRIVVRPNGGYLFNTFYPRSVLLTGQFGWPAVPYGVIEACSLLAERLFKMKREAPLGVIAFEQMAIRVARADGNVMILLAPYMATRIAVA